MQQLILLLFCWLTNKGIIAQTRPHVLSAANYAAQIKAVPGKRLVALKKEIPGIQLDIKYATANNFMHRAMYSEAAAFARAPVAAALKQVEDELRLKGLGLKIFDAYRPYAVTVQFYKMARDTNFVASPQKGSRHNRGCAIDLTLVDLKTGKELEMPTAFDNFSARAAAGYNNLPAIQIKNRETLKKVMQAHNFLVMKTEWWHFDFKGWQQYELLDVPFNKL